MENFGKLMCNSPKFYPSNYKDFIIAHIVDFVIVHKIVIPSYIYMQLQNSYQHFEVLQTCEIFMLLVFIKFARAKLFTEQEGTIKGN